MQLNSLSPAPGSRKARKRVGRGIGSGWGKTCGTGHKGQKSRSGGTVRPGFEGGQMPLQMRLPKFGFSSRVGRITAEVRTSELNKIDADIIDVAALRKANLITAGIKRVKVMLSGDINRAVTLQGIGVTRGARAAIEAAGGKVIEAEAAPAKGKLVKKAARAETASEPKPVAKEKPVKKEKPAAEALAADEAADDPSAKDD
ncbi:MAG: 50S ribosomal protein L15 [Proteobacteria bacterium]|nr:50S ribosomal protein L15 [Pseudomonadota bacterium]